MDTLVKYIERFVHLDEEVIEALNSLAVIKKYSKNDFIVRSGQRCSFIWFLKSGMVRKYHIHEEKEITTWIHTEHQIFTSIHSYSNQSPSEEFIQACENVEAIGISKENSKKLARFPQIVQFTNQMMEMEFVNIDIHSKALKKLDAKGKYAYLNEIAPEVIKRAKLIHIASVLDLSPETVSRIRRFR